MEGMGTAQMESRKNVHRRRTRDGSSGTEEGRTNKVVK